MKLLPSSKVKNLVCILLVLALGVLLFSSSVTAGIGTFNTSWNDHDNTSGYLIFITGNGTDYGVVPNGIDYTGKYVTDFTRGTFIYGRGNFPTGSMNLRGTGAESGIVRDGTIVSLGEDDNFTCVIGFNKSTNEYANNIFYIDFSVAGRIGIEGDGSNNFQEAGTNVDSGVFDVANGTLGGGQMQQVVIQVRKLLDKFDLWYTDGKGNRTLLFDNSAGNGYNGNIDYMQIGGSSTGGNFSINYVICFNDTFEDIPLAPDAPPADTHIIEMVLTTIDGTIYETIAENNHFFIGNNYTINDVLMTNSFCNFTAGNISAHFAVERDANLTLTNAGDETSIVFTENNLSLINDFYEFTLCRINLNTDVWIRINDILVDTLNIDIPKCNLGTHTEIKNITEFNNVSIINFTVTCPNCNGGNQRIIIVSDNDNETLLYERVYLEHFENLTYNTSLNIYRKEGHKYHYRKSGVDIGNISFSCNNSVQENFTFDIENVNLTINILSIDDIAFINGMNIEQENLTDISINVFGDFISFLEFNLSYGNGTLIKTTNQQNMQLNTSEVNTDGIYNITIFARDDEGNSTYQQGYFNLNDTGLPIITWTNPLQDNTTIIEINTSAVFSMSFIDINLFAWNVSLYDSENVLMLNTEQIGNTNQSKRLLFEFLPNITGVWRIETIIADDHTIKEIDDYFIQAGDEDNSKYLIFDKEIKLTFDKAIEVTTEKLDDRITFTSEYSKLETNYKTIIVESTSKLYYLPNSEYTAHFVDWSNKKWIDFETQVGTIPPKIVQINNTAYRVEFDTSLSQIKFNSIGGLNVVEEHTEFLVYKETEVTTLLTNFDLTELSNVVLLFILVFLWIALQVLAFTFNNFAFGSFGFFIGVIIGFMFVNLHIFVTILFILMNIILYISLAKRKRS